MPQIEFARMAQGFGVEGFASVVAEGLTKAESGAHFYAATAIAALIVAFIGPFVGALADFGAKRERIWITDMQPQVIAKAMTASAAGS